MDLDDLKKSWNSQPLPITKNTGIMELIRHKSTGPVAALKKGFKKQMRLMVLVPVLLLLTNVKDWERTFSSPLFWSYVVFCAGVFVYAWAGYRLVTKMEAVDGRVKATLQQQVALLETRLKRHATGLRLALLYFIVLAEVLPHFQHYGMLAKWQAVSPVVRFGAYAALALFQSFAGRRLSRRRFGTHLLYLKSLVTEMQDG